MIRTRSLARGSMLAALFFLPVACGSNSDSPPAQPSPYSIRTVKTEDWRARIGEMVEVEGYLLFGANGTGVLVEDLDDFRKNTAVAERRYVAIDAERASSLSRDTFERAKVRVVGEIRESPEPSRRIRAELTGDLAMCEILVTARPEILELRPGPVATFLDPCKRNPGLCDIFTPGDVEKHALLYSGGIDADSAYTRYWNDMVLYYTMLVWLFGYEPDNITVVYKDGVGENGDMPVDHPATPAGLAAAFSELDERLDFNDDFFLFTTNHGGTISDAGSPDPADEDFGADTIDETAFYYDSGTVAYDDDFAAYVNSLSFGRMCCVMEQCFSGGMIYDLRGPNRVICAACRETEVSWGGAEYDVFVMLFASALIGINQETGDPVDADENNDGNVSIYEAFRWATANDEADETPQYEDSGEGISISLPAIGSTTDGSYGFSFFL